jgi:Ca2+-binding RTX toxin-like protein
MVAEEDSLKLLTEESANPSGYASWLGSSQFSDRTLSYSFESVLPWYYDENPANPVGSFGAVYLPTFVDSSQGSLPAGLQSVVNSLLSSTSDFSFRSSFSDVANISFVVSNSGLGDIAVMRANLTDSPEEGITDGGTYAPSLLPNHQDIENLSTSTIYAMRDLEGGDVWIDNRPDLEVSSAIGQRGYRTVLHELGHALGLHHTNQHESIDSELFSVMSYQPTSEHSHAELYMGAGNDTFSVLSPYGLQLLDIAALQTLYGRNYEMRNENLDSNPETTGTTYSQATALNRGGLDENEAFIYTIWDGGGTTDAIDASGFTSQAKIDLRQGYFSSIGKDGVFYTDRDGQVVRRDGFIAETDLSLGIQAKEIKNVAIAFHTVIENARGTGKGDVIVGNDWANKLEGGKGDDFLYGDGSVYTDRSAGFIGVDADDPNTSEDESEIDPNSTRPILNGLTDDDILIGGAGKDQLYGGKGNDTFTSEKILEGDIYNGGGDDLPLPNDGLDTLDYTQTAVSGLVLQISSVQDSGEFVVFRKSDATLLETGRIQDQAFSIEHFILTADSDTASFEAGVPSEEVVVEGGAGEGDKIDFSGSSAGITVDAQDGEGYRTIDTIKFKEFEVIAGSNTANDIFNGGQNAIIFDGGGHVVGTLGDIVDYSGLVDPTGQNGPGVGYIIVDLTNDTITAATSRSQSYVTTVLNVETFIGTQDQDFFRAKEGLTGITFDGSGGRDAVDFSAFTSGVTVNIDAGTGTVALFNIEEINGSHHDDQLNGSIGNEFFFGNGGADTILAGEGDDFLNGGAGADILGGGSGGDVFYYAGADLELDTVFASTGSDTLFLGGALHLTGETPFSRSGGDFIIEGIATVNDPDSLESIEYSDGARFEVASLGHTVPFYFPDSFVSGTNLDDPALDGTSGNDIFTWSFGNDVLNGGSGHDIADYTGLGQGIVVTLDGGNAVVQKSLSFQDSLNNFEGFNGTDWGDEFHGDINDNEYVGGTGNDFLYGGGGSDILESGGGSDWIEGEGGNDWIYGGGNGLLFGGDGSDHIYGENGDQVSGGDGQDFLYGTSGAILDGGAGNDFLKGSGSTIYVESAGTDVIAGGGILELTSSSLGSLTFYKAENGSIVLDKGNGDSIIIVSGISTIRDGATDYDYATVLQAANVKFLKSEYNHVFGGTTGGDTYDSADAGSDTILSAGGNNLYLFDTANFDARTDIYGLTGGTETVVLSDAGSLDAFTLIRNASAPTAFSLYYGAGEIRLQDVSSVTSAYQVKLGLTNVTHTLTTLDFVTRGSFLADEIEGDVPGFSFDDVMYGEGGDDEIDGGEGQDTLYGGTGADHLIGGLGADTLDGGSGDDEIDGGVGDDTLIDSEGNDTYTLTSGDTLVVGSGDNLLETALTDLSSVILDFSGFGLADALSQNTDHGFVRDFSGPNTSDLRLAYGANTLLLDDYADYTLAPSVLLAGNSLSALTDLVVVGYGGEGDDFYNEQNFLTMDDFVYAGDGNDGFSFMDGNDTVYGGAGDDSLGKIGTFAFNPGTGTFELISGSGDLTAYGEEGNDTLQGGAGDDYLSGGAGDDNFNNFYAGGTDVLDGGAGNDLFALGAEGDSTVLGGEGNDWVALYGANIFSGASHSFVIDLDAQTVTGGAAEHTLSSIENAYGSDQDDTILGNAQTNFIEGGDGNDELEGGLGSDVFWYGGSFGYEGDDTILDAGGTADAVSFYDTVLFEDILFTVIGLDLEIDYLSGTVLIQNQFASGGANRIENLMFADGSSLDLTTYLTWTPADDTANVPFNGTSGIDVLYALGGNDALFGLAASDSLHGGAGDDTLNGEDGDDLLDGGIGSDALVGGAGSDTASYLGAAQGIVADLVADLVEDGLEDIDTLSSVENIKGSFFDDTFVSGTGANILAGGSGVDTVDYSASTLKVLIDLKNATASSGYAQGDVLTGIENVIGSDDSGERDTIYGDANANVITGLDGNDILEGGGGADIIDGGEGWDYARYTRSTSAVTVNLETQVNIGGDAQGDIILNIEAITGSAHADTLIGDGGANYIRGGNGNDTLAGNGGGQDLLFGEAGNDTYFFTSGTVVMSETTGTDRIVFDSIWRPDEVVVNGNFISFEGAVDNITLNTGVSLFEEFEFFGFGVMDLATLISLNPDAPDTIGDGGENIFLATAAAESFYGLEGIDTVSYENSTLGVWVDLLNNSGQYGDAANDTYYDIENVTGSNITHITGSDTAAERDRIWGNEGVNILKGLAGNDILEGDGGADVIDGGDGWDYARYERAGSAVQINLETGVHTGGDAAGDTLLNIEAVTGSSYGDTLTGGNANDYLNGGGGNDVLNGRGGADVLLGGNGADTFVINMIGPQDIVSDFSLSQNDVIDLHDLYTIEYDPLQDAIDDFVTITDDGQHSYISVDVAGEGDNFIQIAELGNITGLSAASLYAADKLILAESQV